MGFISRRTMTSSMIFAAGLTGTALLLVGCGSTRAATPPASATGTVKQTKAQGSIGNITPPPPLAPGQRADPDSMNMGGPDASWTIAALGKGRYKLSIQNTSRIGFIDTVDWRPPSGDTVENVQTSSVGSCALANGRVSCSGLHLNPPTCLCRPGGTATVTFTMHTAGPLTGFVHSALQVLDMTPVPYVIPSTSGSSKST